MREPRSLPTKYELYQVSVGVCLGAFLAWLLMNIASSKAAAAFAFILPGLLVLAWMLVNAIGYFRESAEQSRKLSAERENLEREAATSRYWVYEANRAATNKRTGLAWTGYRKRK